MPSKNCEFCGTSFTKSSQADLKRYHYCSRKCFHLAKAEKAFTPRECKLCKKEFTPKRCRQEFCSYSCSGRNRRKQKVAICQNCHSQFLPKQASKNRIVRFCSKKCWYSFAVKSNNPAWRGGKISFYGQNWRKQAQKARERDNHQCQLCHRLEKELARQLEVHHIIPFRKFGIERYKEANRLENLISLCGSCHRKTEKDSRQMVFWPTVSKD